VDAAGPGKTADAAAERAEDTHRLVPVTSLPDLLQDIDELNHLVRWSWASLARSRSAPGCSGGPPGPLRQREAEPKKAPPATCD
jgi:hypothetical protein